MPGIFRHGFTKSKHALFSPIFLNCKEPTLGNSTRECPQKLLTFERLRIVLSRKLPLLSTFGLAAGGPPVVSPFARS